MSHTIRNLRDIEDMAPRFGLDAAQEARFPRGDLGAEQVGLAYHVIKPGKHQAIAHRHERAEEVYVILRGSGRVKLEDEVSDVREYDAIRVSARTARSFEAGPEGLELLAFGVHHGDDRGEMLDVEEFWANT